MRSFDVCSLLLSLRPADMGSLAAAARAGSPGDTQRSSAGAGSVDGNATLRPRGPRHPSLVTCVPKEGQGEIYLCDFPLTQKVYKI